MCNTCITNMLTPMASLYSLVQGAEIGYLKHSNGWRICSQVIDELTEMMNMNKEQVEKTVHESKCDELSAMFNMMMDNKRKEKGKASDVYLVGGVMLALIGQKIWM